MDRLLPVLEFFLSDDSPENYWGPSLRKPYDAEAAEGEDKGTSNPMARVRANIDNILEDFEDVDANRLVSAYVDKVFAAPPTEEETAQFARDDAEWLADEIAALNTKVPLNLAAAAELPLSEEDRLQEAVAADVQQRLRYSLPPYCEKHCKRDEDGFCFEHYPKVHLSGTLSASPQSLDAKAVKCDGDEDHAPEVSPDLYPEFSDPDQFEGVSA